ncbi:putative F-box/FBD/LRR-repeat protein At3g49040 [Bidens hawaiensis]|uniref:putative F-box/FBD/LRR-repeat protein At3g49040 n=1 Tax=Bidens hawaiensis TaxID=980011 RepID=UPI00404ACEEE
MYVDSYFHKGGVRRMDSGTGNVNGDRLSNFPYDLIHKILALIDTKHAVMTSSLSSRWRYIWTSMRHLNFSNKHFHTMEKFFEFVKGVLSGRNNQIQVSSVTLTTHGRDDCTSFVRRILNVILNYAVSHNVQQLSLAFPCYREITMTPSAWDLQALTTLNLKLVELYDDKSAGLFSNLFNLKNLTLSFCMLRRRHGSKFNICHPGLCNLPLEGGCSRVTVVTPRLKNLIIKKWKGVHVRSAPDLASLRCEGHYYPLQLPADLLHLEKVDISSFRPFDVILRQILGSSVELITHQPSPFANLKSLTIHPNSDSIYSTKKQQTQPIVTMCTEVKNYLLDGSPEVTFTMVSHD